MSTLTVAQARADAGAAGFTGAALDTIVAIAQAESGLVTDARNINADSHVFPDGHVGPSTDRGILQINNFWWPQFSDAQCDDPVQAFAAGYLISQRGTTFTPWSTYTSGAYRQYMPIPGASSGAGAAGSGTAITMRQIPNAQAVSEFIAGYNGDCGETAEIALLHVINPSVYQLNAGALATVVRRDISHGWSSSNGSEPLSAIADDLGLEHLAFTNYGYSEPAAFDWRGMLAQWGGIKPIIFEYARAGAGLPGDEPGVQYHFNTCLGWDPATGQGLFADGDNSVERQGGSALVIYSEADLATAQVCGMLVGEYQLGGVVSMVPAGWTDDGTKLTAPNGENSTLGFRDFVLNFPGGWQTWNWPLQAAYGADPLEVSNPALGGGTRQVFRATVLEWTPARGVFVAWIGDEYLALQAQLTKARTDAASETAQVSSADAQVTHLQAQVAQLQAQLAAAQNTPTPTPPAPVVAPLSPADQAAINAIAAIKEALATS